MLSLLVCLTFQGARLPVWLYWKHLTPMLLRSVNLSLVISIDYKLSYKSENMR